MALIWDRQLFDETYKSVGERYGLRQPANHIYLHYNYFNCGGSYAKEYVRSSIVAPLNLKPGMSVLLVGSGFGWTGEVLRDQFGIVSAGTDTSTFIVNNKTTSEEADLRSYIIAAGHDPDTHLILGPPQGHPLAVQLARSDGELEWWINPLDLWLRERNGIAGIRTSVEIAFEDATTIKSRATIKKLLTRIDYIITEAVLSGLESDDNILSFCDTMANLASAASAAKVAHTVAPFSTETHPKMLSKTTEQWRTLLNSGGFNNQMLVGSAMGAF